jgi:hypothetical protein
VTTCQEPDSSAPQVEAEFRSGKVAALRLGALPAGS